MSSELTSVSASCAAETMNAVSATPAAKQVAALEATIAALQAELARKHEAYQIAHEQASKNGQRLLSLQAELAEAREVRRQALTEAHCIAKAAQYSKTPATDTMRGIERLLQE